MKLTRKKLLTPSERRARRNKALFSFMMVIAWTTVLVLIVKWKYDQDAKFNRQNVEAKTNQR